MLSIKLIIAALLCPAASALLYLAERRGAFQKISCWMQQTIIGILFGLIACFASSQMASIDIGQGVLMNVRDSAPLCAGLIFGGPAGILAGIIGGVWRFVSAFYGLTGTYTQLACTIATILSGFIAAGFRHYLFDNKKPSWIFGVGIAMLCEIIHMLMIFFTNVNDAAYAFNFVKVLSLPMIALNGVSVGLSLLLVSLIAKEYKKPRETGRHITRVFQFWLLVVIVLGFGLTSAYTYMLQSQMSANQTQSLLETNLNDVYQDVLETSDESLLTKAEAVRHEYQKDNDSSTANLSLLARDYGVQEIHIVDLKSGLVTASSNEVYIDFDMNSGEQSREFLENMEDGQPFYIQELRPQTFNDHVERKYGAVSLGEGEILQVSFDASRFQESIEEALSQIAKNRHIGNSGFVLICSANWKILNENNPLGVDSLTNVGHEIEGQDIEPNQIFDFQVQGTSYIGAYGEVEGFHILAALPESEAHFMRDVSIYLSSFMEVLIFAILFVLVYYLIKKLVIDNLIEVNNALAKITNGNLDVSVNVRSNEEFASLSDDINLTVDTLKRYIAEAEQRIDKELEFAKQIQHSALPSVFPPFPAHKEFELYATMDTAKEVGGDFYDFYLLNDDTIAFLIADVSGKGIPAAMFMMKAKTIIKDLAESGLAVSEILSQANDKLAEGNEAEMFVTAWMGIVDLKTGLMHIANAGHNPPLIKHGSNPYAYQKMRPGFVLAGMEGMMYKQFDIQLAPGDQVYVYTDGVTEATNSQDELFGEERLLEVLNEKHREVAEICSVVKENLDQFVGEADQFDDITMIAFQLNYIRSENMIRFVPDEASSRLVSQFSDQLTARLDVLPKIASKVAVVIDEIASNILYYSKASEAQISYEIKNNLLELTFIDNGTPYNPLEKEDPDITLSAQEREIGGLGIFLVKKMAEKVEYRYENGQNILIVTLKLQG